MTELAGGEASERGQFQLHGRGGDLVLKLEGPSASACLAAAVEALASWVGEEPGTHVRREGRTEEIELHGEGLEALLVELVNDAIARLDADAELAVGLREAYVAEGTLRAVLELVPLEVVTLHGAAPKAATWHGVQLAADSTGRWRGEVLVDL